VIKFVLQVDRSSDGQFRAGGRHVVAQVICKQITIEWDDALWIPVRARTFIVISFGRCKQTNRPNGCWLTVAVHRRCSSWNNMIASHDFIATIWDFLKILQLVISIFVRFLECKKLFRIKYGALFWILNFFDIFCITTKLESQKIVL